MIYSRGSKFVTTVRPKLALTSIFSSGTTNAPYTANDILFDWTGFPFPKHPFAAKLVGLTVMVQGLDTALVEETMNIFFAQPNPDGTAPPQLGPEHAAIGNPPANGTPIRNYLGRVDTISTDNDEIFPFNAFYQLQSSIAAADVMDLAYPMILGSEALTTATSNPGHLYISARALGTPDFGTGIALDEGSGVAATTAATTITVKTQDPRKVFSIGDTIHAHDGAKVGVLTGFGDAAGSNKDTKLIFGGGIENALADDDELINLQPITIRLMFEA